MKTSLLCSLFLVCMLAAVPTFAQPSLGFTNLNGFPSVVSPGTQYNLSGWLVNNGTAAFTGSVDVEMELNAQNILPISNNFAISTPLQPGDSVYWTKPNHTFPPGQFRLGNNDVLIWPTAPSIHSDTLWMPVYYFEGAAFRLNPTSFAALGAGIDVDTDYTFSCDATNVGLTPNYDNIQLFAKIAGHNPELIAETIGIFDPGTQVEFSVQDFNVAQLFHLSQDQGSNARITSVDFYALEKDAAFEPYNQVGVGIVELTVGVGNPAPSAVMVYPNPCSDVLNLELPADWSAGMVTVMDMTGRTLLEQPAMGLQVDVAALPSGVYALEVKTETGSLRQSFIRR
jgi:hypothetical protein